MRRSVSVLSALVLAASGLATTSATAAPPSNPGTDRASEVAAFWTAERMAAAQPRDLVLDERGLAYLRAADGSLRPYGHSTPAGPTAKPVEQGKPAGGGGGTKTTVVKNSRWPGTGTVQTAAGRIYFYMPDDTKALVGYVCSGTVVTDETLDRSIILTAAHCVYDDEHDVFASNVMFIPNQAASGTPTDRDCSNDVLGCWTPTHGVVDVQWTNYVFPNNIAWDYAYYVVPTSGAHTAGTSGGDDSLEVAAKSLSISFKPPLTGAMTHALGYSYSNDPYFMYCAQGMSTNGSANWWLSSCGLSGGASGGPWMQPVDNGNGPVISVNSWGYNGQPGMAGPKLSGTTAEKLFIAARTSTPTDGGVIVR